ncbi:glycosyltransferase [Draconibacterium halophilum]|uniref:Glycosyltransferase family 4 protein n=1 Tax=Draconibacterium halophilum TaxID=2706887 RepID=A0A6C0RB70_9BACT|nr:glycosyltransferase [Draconibacterium halophilum]QIA06723.1 glycosyltransferase family 4 protein [Draconibacterium halophilum]
MKKVLIIAYYWPPSGGGGVQRWLKFTKYLPENGWKPIVVVPKNPEYPVIDQSLEADVAKEATVLKMPIWEPYGLFKKLTGRKKDEKVNTGLLFDEKKQSFTEKLSLWIRGNILIPDPRIFWVRPTAKRLQKLIPELKPDFIITTGTPHSIHLIGRRLKNLFPEIPWLADLRDPWSDLDMLDQFYVSGWARNRQRSLEQSVLETADVVTTVSPTWTKELQAKVETPVHCITNGYDSEDFKNYDYQSANDNFIISHVGIINSYRNPEPLWSALEELCTELPDFKRKLKLQIIGITDAGLGKSLDKFPQLRERTSVTGYIPHEEVVKKYQESACLLLLLNNTKNSNGHIPGKFFEYLASGKPILAIAPENSDVAGIINDNQFGFACDFEDKEKIKETILQVFKNSVVIPDTIKVNEYSRRDLTYKLVKLLKNL